MIFATIVGAQQGNHPTIVHGPVLSASGVKRAMGLCWSDCGRFPYPLKLQRSHFLARVAGSHALAQRKMVYFWNKAELAVAERDATWSRWAWAQTCLCLLQIFPRLCPCIHVFAEPKSGTEHSTRDAALLEDCSRVQVTTMFLWQAPEDPDRSTSRHWDVRSCLSLFLSKWLGFCSTWLFPGGWNEEISGAWHGNSH